MDTESNNNITLFYPDRLDKTNAEEYKEKFFKELDGIPEDATVVCDIEGTEYISSAGLRLAMMIKKKFKNTLFENVGDVVYDIFETTGMTELFSVKRKPKKIDPITTPPIARGSNGEVYIIEKDIIVKMFSVKTTPEEIHEEWKNAKTAFVLGVPSVICYAMVTDGKRLGIMFERMETSSLATVIYGDYEHFDDYAGRFAGLLKEMHSIHDEKHELHRVKDGFLSLLERADYLTEDEKDKIIAFLEAIPHRDNVVHGDFHPNNIGENMGELILLDLAEIGYGHPIFDFIATYYDLVLSGETTGKEHPEITKQFFGLTVDELGRLWDITLEQYFPDLTSEKKQYFNETMNMMLGFKLLLFPALHPNHEKEKHEQWLSLGRERFVDHYDEVISRIQTIDEMICGEAG